MAVTPLPGPKVNSRGSPALNKCSTYIHEDSPHLSQLIHTVRGASSRYYYQAWLANNTCTEFHLCRFIITTELGIHAFTRAHLKYHCRQLCIMYLLPGAGDVAS
eukprot:scpid109102/ scgid14017/ 